MLRQQGDLDGAEQCYLRAISAGDIDAMNNLGNLLRQRGRFDEAVRWWQTAAEAGSADSQASYGAHHAELGDWDKAEYWWRLAAEQGNLTGMHNLALSLTRRGRSAEAETWLRRATGNEYTDAPPSPQAEAGVEDLVLVSAWLGVATDRGNADARAALEQLERDWPA
jgi:TPR repeat protein